MMAIKYISKNKDGIWKISTTKTGKAIKTFNTQKEAIAFAGTIKSTESILIKRENGWSVATGWDLNVATSAKKVAKNSKAQGKSVSQAKAKAVAKVTETPVELKKVETKKKGKSYIKWILLYLFLVAAGTAGFLIYWFLYR